MTNKYVQFDTTSEPMKKRAHIVKMNASFTEGKITKQEKGIYKKDSQFVEDLKTIYKNEVFSWIVRGAYNYYKDGHLERPAICVNEMKEYIEMIDPVCTFVNNECSINPEARINRTDLFEAFINWCKDKGEKMLSREKFYFKIASIICFSFFQS